MPETAWRLAQVLLPGSGLTGIAQRFQVAASVAQAGQTADVVVQPAVVIVADDLAGGTDGDVVKGWLMLTRREWLALPAISLSLEPTRRVLPVFTLPLWAWNSFLSWPRPLKLRGTPLTTLPLDAEL